LSWLRTVSDWDPDFGTKTKTKKPALVPYVSTDMDRQFQSFLQQQSAQQQLRGVIHELTDKCWEVCMKDTKPGPRLEYKTQDCMRACVDRFIDANIMVSRRMGEKGESLARAAARDSEELLS